MEYLLNKIKQLEYHQKILLEMVHSSGNEFNHLIISCSLSELEVEEFHQLCKKLEKKLKEEQAEHYYVYYVPLYNDFVEKLNSKLQSEQVIHACLKQNLYPDLMKVLKSNL